MSLHLTAFVLNRPAEKRLLQSGVLIVSDLTNRVVIMGSSALSSILKKDYERYGEYYVESAVSEKKAVYWYANKIASFMEAAPGYYAFGDYVLYQQALTFEPRLDAPLFLTQEFQLIDDPKYGVEKITLQKVV